MKKNQGGALRAQRQRCDCCDDLRTDVEECAGGTMQCGDCRGWGDPDVRAVAHASAPENQPLVP